MKCIRPAILMVALLISACGAQSSTPAALDATTPPPGAPTEELFVSASSAPAPSAAPSAEATAVAQADTAPSAAATAASQAGAAPTARLIPPPGATASEPAAQA